MKVVRNRRVMGREERQEAVRLEGVVARRGGFGLGPLQVVLDAGKTLGILGASGTGKSTLLDLVAGLVLPVEGRVWLGGRLVATARRVIPAHRRGVAYLLQETGLWGRLDARANVRAVVRGVGAAKTAERLLDLVGLRAPRDRAAGTLSGGERRRVGVARALACEAPLLLLDEPASGLDPAAAAEVAGAVRAERERSGTSLCAAAHDLDALMALEPDRLLLLEDGRELASGPTQEIVAAPGRRRVAERLGYATFLPAEPVPDGWRCALGTFRDARAPRQAPGAPPPARPLLAWRRGELRCDPEGESRGTVMNTRTGRDGPVTVVAADGGRLVEILGEADTQTVGVQAHTPALVEDDG